MRLLSLSVVLLVACAPARSEPVAPVPVEEEGGIAIAARMSLTGFQRLRWLEGTWRGSGVDAAPFWERYAFVNDSTIRLESFGDSALTGEPEVGTIRWRDGRVTTGSGGALWVVTAFDETTLRFDPVAGARNWFVWSRDAHDDDAWTAVLSWPASGTVPARERIYTLRRIR